MALTRTDEQRPTRRTENSWISLGRNIRTHVRRAAFIGTLSLHCMLLLTGCESTSKAFDTLGNLKDKTLEASGLKTPTSALPDAALPSRRIPFVLTASPSLNVDDEGHALALVVRIYKLKSVEAFLSAPYQTFTSPDAEKQRLGEDLIEVREIQLVPQQKVDTIEKVGREASYVGVVALFHAPSAQHWKFVFNADAAQASGITLAAHACVLGVSRGQPYGLPISYAPPGLGACRSSRQ